MFANRLRLLHRVLLLVALVVSSMLTHNHAKENNSVTALTEAELLQKYIELCEQNAAERIQFLQRLLPVEQSYLWRMHLGLYLAHNLTLSRDQQKIVIETLGFVGPKLFVSPNPKDPGGRIVTLENQVRRLDLQLFSKDEAAEIFSAIGGAQDGEALRKYSQLSDLSKEDRKASFSLMSAEDKSSLWRVHLGLNLARHSEWTEQQRSIILEAITMATPQLYKTTPKDSNWTRLVDEPVRLLMQKALLVFTKEEGVTLFSELGFSEPKLNHAKRPVGRGCACSQESDWCIYQCVSTECTVVIWSCGTFGIYACNGRCYGS